MALTCVQGRPQEWGGAVTEREAVTRLEDGSNSGPPTWISGDMLRELVAPVEAVEALRAAFAGSRPISATRVAARNDRGELLLMASLGDRDAGVKLLTSAEAVPGCARRLLEGVFVLFDEDLLPRAFVDAAELTALRTAAVSALAADYLANTDVDCLLVFGAGTQAAAHVAAMRAIRPIREVIVVGRSEGPAERMRTALSDGTVIVRAGTPEEVAAAGIICTCTTSRIPLFDGGLLVGGTHVSAVGTYVPDARELDDVTMSRGRIVVEDRDAVLAATGDLVIPLRSGAIQLGSVVADLSEVVRGHPVRESRGDITVFKSVGLAMEDLVVARLALAKYTK